MQLNDEIVLDNFNYTATKSNKKTIYKPTKQEKSGAHEIFIENYENFVVINKPSGISVQSGTKSRRNILDILNCLVIYFSDVLSSTTITGLSVFPSSK